MGQSIGELFVKLGFDVDDTKLKAFDDSIKGVFNGIKQLAGYAGVGLGVAGFVELAKHASDTALTVENLTKVYGVNEKAVRSWAAAVHENNPLKSFNEGVSSFAQISSYLNNATFTTQGVMALNRLGVRWDTSMVGHPEKVIEQLFKTIPSMLHANPNARGLIADLIGKVTGDAANIGIFERGSAWANAAAARASTSEADNNRMTSERRKIAALEDQWDSFINHVMGSLAGHVLKMQGNKEGFLAGVWQGVQDLGAWNPLGLGSKTSQNLIQGIPLAVGMAGKALINRENIKGMLERYGWSPEQAAGITQRLMKESGFNPNITGDNGQAYGLAQWHPDRQRDFSRFAGRDIHGSSIEDQIAFLNYELTKGNERSAGNKLRRTKSQEDAYATFTNEYERPAVSVHVTQNIHSSDPDQAGRIAAQAIQDTITKTTLDRMPEPY